MMIQACTSLRKYYIYSQLSRKPLLLKVYGLWMPMLKKEVHGPFKSDIIHLLHWMYNLLSEKNNYKIHRIHLYFDLAKNFRDSVWKLQSQKTRNLVEIYSPTFTSAANINISVWTNLCMYAFQFLEKKTKQKTTSEIDIIKRFINAHCIHAYLCEYGVGKSKSYQWYCKYLINAFIQRLV